MYASFRKIVKTAGRRAGIKKRVYPYLFRHSRLTELARTGFTGYQFNLFAGWSLDSKMASTYIHLLSTDVDNAILKLNGIVKEQEPAAEFRPVVCPRCKRSNAPGTGLCLTCGSALDIRYALQADQKREDVKAKIERVSAQLAESPEILDMLLDALDMLRGSKVSDNQD